MVTSYDFLYRGANPAAVQDAIASWCKARDCDLEVIPLTTAVRFRILGQHEAVREAIATVRTWIRGAA